MKVFCSLGLVPLSKKMPIFHFSYCLTFAKKRKIYCEDIIEDSSLYLK